MTICIIDDEPWALRDLSTVINWSLYGFSEVKPFGNPVEAFEFIRENKPEVVITDVCMPGMSGLDLIRLCRSENIDCLFAVVSAYAEFEYARQALENNVFSYILKPIKYEIVKDLAMRLSKEAEYRLELQKSNNLPKNQGGMGAVIRYVDANYTHDLSLEGLCNQFGYSVSHMCRTFKKVVGQSFKEYLTSKRINYACQLISGTDLSLMQTAQLCGFQDYFHFSKLFSRKTGCSPSQYRKNSYGQKK